MPRCFYFGCWNAAGHYLHLPGGRSSYDDRIPAYYGGARYITIDGTLAPRRMDRGDLCWIGLGATRDERSRLYHRSSEYPQGQFLLHHLDNGYTAIQWWDRNQGDTRGACNSTILLDGRHTSEEMLAALREHFPHVLANLERAGVKLVDVTPSTASLDTSSKEKSP